MPLSGNFEEGTIVRLILVQSHIMQMYYIYLFFFLKKIYKTLVCPSSTLGIAQKAFLCLTCPIL